MEECLEVMEDALERFPENSEVLLFFAEVHHVPVRYTVVADPHIETRNTSTRDRGGIVICFVVL